MNSRSVRPRALARAVRETENIPEGAEIPFLCEIFGTPVCLGQLRCACEKSGEDAPVIYLSEADNPEARNWYYARALGHAMLHMGWRFDPEMWENTREHYLKSFTVSQTVEARLFADELLMPKESFLKALSAFTENGEIRFKELAQSLHLPEKCVRERASHFLVTDEESLLVQLQ